VDAALHGERSVTPAAIIFDMDGTLAATISLWRQAEFHLLDLIGQKWTPELAKHYNGMNSRDVATTIHRLTKTSLSLELCQETMRTELFKAFETTPPEPMPGAVECVERLAGLAPLTLASGSPLPLIEFVVERLKIKKYFTHLLSSESVQRGKPFPDVFLASAAAINVEPTRCLVIEDSLIGVQAAKAAGMKCFAVPITQADEIVAVADETFDSLELLERSNVEMVF